jgi:hypothetical protein
LIAELVLEVHSILNDAGIDHAFGGALALNYYAEARGTVDVDVNLSVPAEGAASVADILRISGFEPELPEGSWLPVAGLRMMRSQDVVDLFFSFDDYHRLVLDNAVLHPFPSAGGSQELPFLAADDLVVMKLSLNRTKDWADIEAMIAAGTPIDVGYVRAQLVAFRGATTHPRVARLSMLLETRS